MEKLNLGMIQHGTSNHLKLESVLLQRIIDAQRNDEGMKHLHEKMEAGKANCFRRDDQGVVWFNNHIVVPKNDEIRLLGVCFVAEGLIRRNTFGRLTRSRSYQLKGFGVYFQMHRLKDEMTNWPMIICIMIVNLCKGHECNSPQAASCAYK
jgi:hypothetical protein